MTDTLNLHDVPGAPRPSVAMSGNLQDIPLTDVIQTVMVHHRSGVVRMELENHSGALWFEGGQIVHAQLAKRRGEAAVFSAMAGSQGQFRVEFDVAMPERNLSLPTTALLMEGVRRLDECNRLLQVLEADTFGLTQAATSAWQPAAGSDDAIVSALFVRTRSVATALGACALGELEALTSMARLLEGGVLRRVPHASIAPEPRREEATSVMEGEVEIPVPERSTEGVTLNDPTEFEMLPPALTKRRSARRGTVAIVAAVVMASAGVAAAMVMRNTESESEPVSGDEVSAVEPTAVPSPTPAPDCPAGMVRVDGGAFFMGSDSGHPVLRLAAPAHHMKVGSYCIDVTEVTVQAYEKCSDRGACKRAFRTSEWPQGGVSDVDHARVTKAHGELCNGGKKGHGKHPVNCVSWAQAERYCTLNGGRLPTEAEWEFAARGSDGRVYPWGDAPPTAEHVNACGAECAAWHEKRGMADEIFATMYKTADPYPGTAPVGTHSKGATKGGLLDMTGNVFEWTADRYHSFGDKGPAPDEKRRVIRGGAFNSGVPQFADPALRYPMDAAAHTHGVGFRCAADVSSP